jgi:hypothetical protein
MMVAGQSVTTLDAPARTLHIALHAAQHGRTWPGGPHLRDLDRAIAQLAPEVWREARDLAATLQATSAFRDGLHVTPAGARLARTLNLGGAPSVEARLRAGNAPQGALGWEQLAKAQPTEQVRIAVRKVIPSVRFMRVWSPLARRGRVGLAMAYVWRPIWLAGTGAHGWLAWRRAQREAVLHMPTEPREDD